MVKHSSILMGGVVPLPYGLIGGLPRCFTPRNDNNIKKREYCQVYYAVKDNKNLLFVWSLICA